MEEEYNYKIISVEYEIVIDFTEKSLIDKQLIIFTVKNKKTKEQEILYYTYATEIRNYTPSKEQLDKDNKIAVEKVNIVRQIKEINFKDIEEVKEYVYNILVMIYYT